MRIDSLPMFPLNVVLFPGMVLPLHIFEERYKLMISNCLADDPRFGVALIREGSEVGGPATVYEVGTVARIISVGRYEDGRMDLVTVGVQRFRVLETNAQMPYLRAHVELFRDRPEAPETLQDMATQVLALLDEYRKLLGQEEGEAPEMPEDAESLSFTAGVLHIPIPEKQRMLESVSTPERLSRLSAFLKHEISLLSVLGATKSYEAPRRLYPN